MIASALAGAALGLVGSGHCVAMCGPLLALARPTGPRRALVYHAGRITTYAGIGLATGAWGATAAAAGFGRPLALGAALVLVACAAVDLGLAGRITARVPGSRAVTSVIAEAGQWMWRHQVSGPFALGALNGLLPCGLVYAAAVAAAGLGSLDGALALMVGFGVGTTPALAALGLSLSRLPLSFVPVLRRIAPFAMMLVAVMLLMRGAFPHASHAPAALTASGGAHVHP